MTNSPRTVNQSWRSETKEITDTVFESDQTMEKGRAAELFPQYLTQLEGENYPSNPQLPRTVRSFRKGNLELQDGPHNINVEFAPMMEFLDTSVEELVEDGLFSTDIVPPEEVNSDVIVNRSLKKPWVVVENDDPTKVGLALRTPVQIANARFGFQGREEFRKVAPKLDGSVTGTFTVNSSDFLSTSESNYLRRAAVTGSIISDEFGRDIPFETRLFADSKPDYILRTAIELAHPFKQIDGELDERLRLQADDLEPIIGYLEEEGEVNFGITREEFNNVIEKISQDDKFADFEPHPLDAYLFATNRHLAVSRAIVSGRANPREMLSLLVVQNLLEAEIVLQEQQLIYIAIIDKHKDKLQQTGFGSSIKNKLEEGKIEKLFEDHPWAKSMPKPQKVAKALS